MAKAQSPARWYAPWRQSRAVRSSEPADPADLGTAFGLDLSMTPPDGGAESPAPAQSPHPAPAARPGWVLRLAARRRPSY